VNLTTQKLPPFFGINNQDPAYALPEGHMQAIENLIIDKRGRAVIRPGTTSVYTGTKPHSLFNYRDTFLYWREAGYLLRARPNGTETLAPELVATGLAHDEPMSYAVDSEGWMVWTDRYKIGAVAPDGEATDVAPPTPKFAPEASINEGGGQLHGSGVVKVTHTNIDKWGREGGSDIHTVVGASEGYFSVEVGSPGENTQTYVSDPNGNEYYQLPASGSLTSIGGRRKRLGTRFRYPIPPGTIVVNWMYRWLVATGDNADVLLWSDPYNFLSNTEANAIFFDAPIRIIAPVEGGVYVMSDATYFLTGRDPAKWAATRIHSETAPPGAWCYVDGDNLSGDRHPEVQHVAWLTTTGSVMTGDPNGQIHDETGSVYRATSPQAGAAVFVEIDGVKQLLFATRTN